VWVKLKDKNTRGYTPSITYKNGIVEQSVSGFTQSMLFKNFSIFSYDNFHIQDFRLYDHALSEREIKQLSQGLMVHYPLADDMVESTTNLATYPTPTGKASPAWDASLHPDAITVSGWGYGYNGGVSTNGVKNPEVGYHAYWKIIDSLPTMVFQHLNPTINLGKRWLGISGGGAFQSLIGPSKTYTISFDAKASVPNMVITGGLHYRITGASSNAFHDG
jgi:hypothetical protein